MVRFIINWTEARFFSIKEFTFQYGQIYYNWTEARFFSIDPIYIPIWLDLLLLHIDQIPLLCLHLHSNMVRFIIHSFPSPLDHFVKFTFQYGQIYYNVHKTKYNIRITFTFQYGQIYYLIWIRRIHKRSCNLHSNMVRFIMGMSSPKI